MKRLLLSITCWCCACLSFAQLPASTTPQNRKAVLEVLTGIYCYWCPAGHKIAHNIKASRPPGSVVLVSCHCTGFSSPSGYDPNYKTPDGDSLAEMPGMAVTGVPAGAISRHQWPGQPTIPVSRNLWAGYVDQTLAKPSYVNLALEGTLNVATRQLTVNVQAYYTGNSPVATNRLTVVLLEDTVIGVQGGALDNYPEQTNPDGSYRHQHMLRKMLTSPYTGEVITTTTFGSVVNRSYSFTIPAQFKNTVPAMGNLKLACFMAESNTEIITGAYGPITLTGFTHQRDAAVTRVAAENEVCAGKLSPEVSIYNSGSTPITSAVLSYEANGGTPMTYTYSGFIAPATFKSFGLPLISFTPATLNTLSLRVTGVNGSSDQNSANDMNSQDSIKMTTHIAGDTSMLMEYTMIDVFNGSSWKLYDEATNTVVASDGPFPDVPYMVTEVKSKSFKVRRNTCYRLVRENSNYIGNHNARVGFFTLYAGGTPFITAPDVNAGKAFTWFKTGAHPLGVNDRDAAVADLSVSPNPAYDRALLNFNLKNATDVGLTIYNATGNVAIALPEQRLTAGAQSLFIPVQQLSAGLYIVRVTTKEGAAYTRFSLIR